MPWGFRHSEPNYAQVQNTVFRYGFRIYLGSLFFAAFLRVHAKSFVRREHLSVSSVDLGKVYFFRLVEQLLVQVSVLEYFPYLSSVRVSLLFLLASNQLRLANARLLSWLNYFLRLCRHTYQHPLTSFRDSKGRAYYPNVFELPCLVRLDLCQGLPLEKTFYSQRNGAR